MSRSLRVIATCAAFAVVLSACGDDGLLDGLGTRSQDAVYSDIETTTTIPTVAGAERRAAAVPAIDVEWYNDRIQRQFTGEPSFVAQKVWQRREGETRFIQASRLEITEAVPNIRFPALVPDTVTWVTSQLVFDTTAATLDKGTTAAFGLWAIEPYTVTEGRLAVLRVGSATDDELEAAFEIVPDVVDEGLSLSWVTGGFRYELFCQASMPSELCWQMAETNTLLSAQLRGTATEA